MFKIFKMDMIKHDYVRFSNDFIIPRSCTQLDPVSVWEFILEGRDRVEKIFSKKSRLVLR